MSTTTPIVATTTTTAITTDRGSLTGTYVIDPAHSRIGFVARHAMVTKVRGSFNEFVGSGFFDPDRPERSSIELTIAAGSIDTRHRDRDAHLRSSDFFDVDTYPEIAFRSTSVERVADHLYRVTGDLTIKDLTNPVTVDFEYTGAAVDPDGDQRIGLDGATRVNRKDWGLTWNAALEAGGVLVGEQVTLEFEVSAIRTDDVA